MNQESTSNNQSSDITAEVSQEKDNESNSSDDGLIETSLPRWINNDGDEVKEVFGFNSNAELVNGRAAMCGFIMLILTELAFNSEPVTRTLFGIR
mgnify:CR=1 FL=1|tara:strand:- start:292 stop:576 length:285 start_codon:yes stop_codon:yes gene_type:complete